MTDTKKIVEVAIEKTSNYQAFKELLIDELEDIRERVDNIDRWLINGKVQNCEQRSQTPS